MLRWRCHAAKLGLSGSRRHGCALAVSLAVRIASGSAPTTASVEMIGTSGVRRANTLRPPQSVRMSSISCLPLIVISGWRQTW